MTDIDPDLKSKAELILKNSENSLISTLGIEFKRLALDTVVASMPVTQRTHQPFGLLHGGASVALAETLASTAAWLQVDENKFYVVGLEINANHVRAEREGVVTGTAKAFHIGRSTQVWEVKIVNAEDQLVCISRCTLAVVPK